ncbi:hypothetical protein Hanom_Chr13g01228301 [Helianthus anomalus]
MFICPRKCKLYSDATVDISVFRLTRTGSHCTILIVKAHKVAFARTRRTPVSLPV